MILLQGDHSNLIAELLEVTGFWDAIASDLFSRLEWREALWLAPTLKDDFYTILSAPGLPLKSRPPLERRPAVGPLL